MGIKYNTCHASDHASDAYVIYFFRMLCATYIFWGRVKSDMLKQGHSLIPHNSNGRFIEFLSVVK